jgi:hypothetical protein
MEYTLTKIDAAVHQLDWAVKLLLDHREYIPAITLAGAAEEILGQIVGEQAVFNQLKSKFSTDFKIPEKIISQVYLNKTKNWLKHWQNLEDVENLEVDLEGEAVQYIVRGITNLLLHDSSLPNEGPRFIAWLNLNQDRLNLSGLTTIITETMPQTTKYYQATISPLRLAKTSMDAVQSKAASVWSIHNSGALNQLAIRLNPRNDHLHSNYKPASAQHPSKLAHGGYTLWQEHKRAWQNQPIFWRTHIPHHKASFQ